MRKSMVQKKIKKHRLLTNQVDLRNRRVRITIIHMTITRRRKN